MNGINVLNGEKYKLGEDEGYKCTCCGRDVVLSDSVSFRGWNLTCMNCYHKIQRITGIHNLLNDIQIVGRVLKQAYEYEQMEEK